MTMDNGIYLVINNSNGNAITTAGTGGNIISEDENNRVRLEPARSAEPPNNSGRAGAKAARAFCEALRVAMFSAFSRQAAT